MSSSAAPKITEKDMLDFLDMCLRHNLADHTRVGVHCSQRGCLSMASTSGHRSIRAALRAAVRTYQKMTKNERRAVWEVRR